MKSPSPSISALPSIYDLPLTELGGRIARAGFAYQDHIAVAFCLDLLEISYVQEVWCESHDDITVIYQDLNVTVEYVQVKSADKESRWSLADACRRIKQGKSKKPSLLEQSLLRAQCKEEVLFRIITFTDVAKELTVLKKKKDLRQASEVNALKSMVQKKFATENIKSQSGLIPEDWIEKCRWDAKDSQQSEENNNKIRLQRILQSEGNRLSLDQLEKVYEGLLNLVKLAAEADLTKKPESYRITKQFLKGWIKETVSSVILAAPAAGSGNLRRKMKRCGIAGDLIEKAIYLRVIYTSQRINAGYATLPPFTRLESSVVARLQVEKAALDAGSIDDNGPQFHNRCLTALEEVRGGWSNSKSTPELSSFQGYMYELTNRCVHAFDKVKQ